MNKKQKALEIDADSILYKTISIEDIPYLKTFKSGNGSMDNFLQDAYFHHIMREASTTLVFYKNELIAYFTIKHLPLRIDVEESIDYKYSLDISRLAVSRNYQSKGVGTKIVNDIIKSAIRFNERFITLDAIKEEWVWYRDCFGFEHLYDEDILSQDTIVVSMSIDLYDEKLLSEFFDL